MRGKGTGGALGDGCPEESTGCGAGHGLRAGAALLRRRRRGRDIPVQHRLLGQRRGPVQRTGGDRGQPGHRQRLRRGPGQQPGPGVLRRRRVHPGVGIRRRRLRRRRQALCERGPEDQGPGGRRHLHARIRRGSDRSDRLQREPRQRRNCAQRPGGDQRRRLGERQRRPRRLERDKPLPRDLRRRLARRRRPPAALDRHHPARAAGRHPAAVHRHLVLGPGRRLLPVPVARQRTADRRRDLGCLHDRPGGRRQGAAVPGRGDLHPVLALAAKLRHEPELHARRLGPLAGAAARPGGDRRTQRALDHGRRQRWRDADLRSGQLERQPEQLHVPVVHAQRPAALTDHDGLDQRTKSRSPKPTCHRRPTSSAK